MRLLKGSGRVQFSFYAQGCELFDADFARRRAVDFHPYRRPHHSHPPTLTPTLTRMQARE